MKGNSKMAWLIKKSFCYFNEISRRYQDVIKNKIVYQYGKIKAWPKKKGTKTNNDQCIQTEK